MFSSLLKHAAALPRSIPRYLPRTSPVCQRRDFFSRGAQPLSADRTWTYLDSIAKDKADLHRPENNIKDIWTTYDRIAQTQLARRPPANAYSGRSVSVEKGNTGDAYAKLDSILRRNNVMRELRQAERHEKKGVKRRRLASDRWRRHFANEVKKKVQLVAAIRHRNKHR